jgi:hypothetical protein
LRGDDAFETPRGMPLERNSTSHRCFAKRASSLGLFAPLLKQAQTLIDHMAPK